MKRPIAILLLVLLTAQLACGKSTPRPIPELKTRVFDSNRTAFGFFPTPARLGLNSVQNIFKDIAPHADVVLLQQAVPWKAFLDDPNPDISETKDIHNQYVLAHQNNLDVIFVIDPLNGLNRREFASLPKSWAKSFANPDMRTAMKNFTLYILKEYQPRYLGLGSEINTYADAYPDDFPNYVTFYGELYDLIKQESPQTQVFTTFQWEELNNLIAGIPNKGTPYQINWDQVETFEPKLDVWAISSYPFVAFKSGSEIPADYYTPLINRTSKPLAVSEGGIPSTIHGDEQYQVDYINAIHSQIGGNRLAFWIYLDYSDFDYIGMAAFFALMGHVSDLNTLKMFATVGLVQLDGKPKPALETWDGIREKEVNSEK
jgi:hypothetical protein